MNLFLFLTAVFVCGQNGLGWAFNVEMSPSRFDEITETSVNITCVPDASIDQKAQEIMLLEIARRDSDETIAIVNQYTQLYERITNRLQYKVQGHINGEIPSKSRLMLTISNPAHGDAGLYRCSMYYKDVFGLLVKENAEENLTMDTTETRSVFRYLAGKVTDLERKYEEQKKMETMLLKNISKLQEEVSRKREGVVSSFLARYTHQRPEEKGNTIVFNDVAMKVGQGYDETTGVFTAPTSGVYGFHVAAMLRTTNGWLDLVLYVNQKQEAALSAASDAIWDQSSISVYLQLQEGDEVRVKVLGKVAGQNLRSDHFTFFSGFLLREILL